jgi:hypothetical protein
MRVIAFLAFFALVPQVSPPRDLPAEIDRVRAEASASTPEDERTAPAARLERARAALDAGRPLLAFYLFEMPWESAKAWAFVKSASAITTPEAFAKKWTAVGEPRPVAGPRRTRLPVLVEALASAAEARAVATYHASKAYGEDAGVQAGLYYLGDSHAVVQFAAMARSLPWPEPTAALPALRSLTAELNALDAEMTTAYETMSPANHPAYIVASATLKQARTLNDRGQVAGALLEYLLSTYLFAPLRTPAPAREATPALIAQARQTLGTATDHSIAEMFLQLADEGLSAGASQAQRRGATSVLDAVLPAYIRATGRDATATSPVAAAQVTITLVRWPFT